MSRLSRVAHVRLKRAGRYVRGGTTPPRPVRAVVARLVDVEQHLFGTPGPPAPFVTRWSRLDRVEGPASRLAALATGRLVSVRTRAAHVRIKNNILAFYPEHELVVKIFDRQADLAAHLRGGQAGRERLRTLRVPEVTQSGDHPHPFVRERMVRGHKPSVEELRAAEDTLVDDLLAFHLHDAESRDLILTAGDVTRVLAELEEARVDPPGNLRRLAMAGRDAVIRVVVGDVHGDLTKGNLIHDGRDLYLLDWERSDRGIVAADIRKLAPSLPTLLDRYAHAFAAHAEQWGAIAPIERQAAAAVVAEVARGAFSRDYYDAAGRSAARRGALGRAADLIRAGGDLDGAARGAPPVSDHG